jgi:hypothetical protein
MRCLALAIVILQGSMLTGQQIKHANCGNPKVGVLTYSYSESVWQQLIPHDHQARPVIEITLSFGRKSKLLLRAIDRSNFELLRATLPQNIDKSLAELEDSCRLPPNSADAVDLIAVKWDTARLDPELFGRLHREFIAALAQQVMDAQNRYDSVLEKGGIISFDSQGYSVVYDNGGYEHVEVEGDDIARNRTEPIIKWVQSVAGLADEKFRKSP